MSEGQAHAHTLEQWRWEEEAQWTEMSSYGIEMFFHFHPTYFMSPEEASDFNAGVSAAIKRDQYNTHTMGNSFGTQRYERHLRGKDENNKEVYETVRII